MSAGLAGTVGWATGCSRFQTKGQRTLVGGGPHTYEWIDNWAQLPDSDSSKRGWAHPGLAVTGAGEIITFHAGDPTVLVFDADGRLKRSFDTGLTEGHGMTLVREGGTDFLWIADTGAKRTPDRRYEYPNPFPQGRVVKMTLDGRVVQTIETPDHPAYKPGRFSPTSVAVNEERHGGNGDVWVADGYGKFHVHRFVRFSRGGGYLGSIDGSEGPAGSFNNPHGIWIDTRKSEPELYIADRGNKRVQVYDLEGKSKRAFGADFLRSPSAFARDGEFLIIADLHARLVILDRDDKLVTTLGDNFPVTKIPGWPNEKDQQGVPKRTTQLRPGKFNSPHGLGVDRLGNIFVAEWLIGGRMTKLAKR